MSCASTNCLDGLAQMAPHIIIFDPMEPHPHRDLYHDMIVSEKKVIESRRHRLYHACKNAARKLFCRFNHQASDPEKEQALLLLSHAKSHKLAENYIATASSENLLKRKQSMSNASTLINDQEPQSGEIISIRASSDYSMPKTSHVRSPDTKDGVTVNVCSTPLPIEVSTTSHITTHTPTTSATTLTLDTSIADTLDLSTASPTTTHDPTPSPNALTIDTSNTNHIDTKPYIPSSADYPQPPPPMKQYKKL
ncbi:MAG: hypothetical protein Q9180_009677, partial [Flavoplaca navasiana]